MRLLTKKRVSGFLLVEILISALIIAGSISACFYLFRMGFDYWQRAEQSNKLVRKIPQVVSYLTQVAELEKGQGEFFLGEESKVIWQAKLIEKGRPQIPLPEAGLISPYEIYLYEVAFTLHYQETSRNYTMKIFRYKRLFNPQEIYF